MLYHSQDTADDYAGYRDQGPVAHTTLTTQPYPNGVHTSQETTLQRNKDVRKSHKRKGRQIVPKQPVKNRNTVNDKLDSNSNDYQADYSTSGSAEESGNYESTVSRMPINEDMNKSFWRKLGDGRLPMCFMKKKKGYKCGKKAPVASNWYNYTSNACEPFKYLGCGGNENNFEAVFLCLRFCVDGMGGLTNPFNYYASTPSSWKKITHPSDSSEKHRVGKGGLKADYHGRPPNCFGPRPTDKDVPPCKDEQQTLNVWFDKDQYLCLSTLKPPFPCYSNLNAFGDMKSCQRLCMEGETGLKVTTENNKRTPEDLGAPVDHAEMKRLGFVGGKVNHTALREWGFENMSYTMGISTSDPPGGKKSHTKSLPTSLPPVGKGTKNPKAKSGKESSTLTQNPSRINKVLKNIWKYWNSKQKGDGKKGAGLK